MAKRSNGKKKKARAKGSVKAKQKELEKRAEELPFSELDHRILAAEKLTSGAKAVLMSIPLRNEKGVTWKETGDGTVTLRYKKEFGRFETWLAKKVGAVEYVNVPLDEVGSDLWRWCDGSSTIADICMKADSEYHEKVEPVVPRVLKFFEILLKRRLVYLKSR